MNDNQDIEKKVLDAFKGFINSYKLEPMAINHDRLRPKYSPTSVTFKKDKELLELFYEVESHQRICKILGQLFPGQIDNKLVLKLLIDATTRWIEAGNDPTDQSKLEQAGQEFIVMVREKIRPFLIFLPVEGLKIDSTKCVTLGRCKLQVHDRKSNLFQILEQDKTRWKKEASKESGISKRVKAYFTCEITGPPQKALDRGIEEANLALSMLRLYISFYYFHEYQDDIVYRMGLAGSLNFNEKIRVFYINPNESIVNQFPGFREQRKIYKELEIDDELIEHMEENGLERLNKLFQSLDLNRSGDDVARRLLRAVTWFAKGTNARSIADSFLMYAIAIEGLLSEDRTPQETYATQIAALVTTDKDQLIYPVGGYISIQFAKQLKEAESLNTKYNLVRNRVLDLFNYRNRIAHGAILEDEVNTINLLDFETLAKNTILSFVSGGWESFSAFKGWINKSVRYDFIPQ